MKSLLLATTVLALSVGTAAAQDQVYDWSGAYIGVQGGYSFYDTVQSYPPTSSSVAGHPEPDALTLGGQAGYRHQFGKVVAGIEADIYASFGDVAEDPISLAVNSSKLDVNWGGSVRGQLGYAMDRFLPYITGGLAFIDYDGGTTAGLGFPVAPGTKYSKTALGWTVGAGIAYAVTDNLILNVDYRYSDYGKKTFSTLGIGGGFTSIDLKTHDIRFGIAYKF